MEEVTVAGPKWAADILDGATIAIEDNQLCAKAAKRGARYALRAMHAQLVAAFKAQNHTSAIVRVKPHRPTAAVGKWGTAAEASRRTDSSAASNLPFKVVCCDEWPVRVAAALGVNYVAYCRPSRCTDVLNVRLSFTPQLSAAQTLNCKSVAFYFGPMEMADSLASAIGARQKYFLSDTLVQYRCHGSCPLYAMSTCTPLQYAISCIYAVFTGVAEGLGHLPLRLGLFGHAEFCDVAVVDALSPLVAGRSGDDLELVDPFGRTVGAVRDWVRSHGRTKELDLKPLINMHPDSFNLRSAVFGSPLNKVPAATVDAWLYGLKPPRVVLATPRSEMLELGASLMRRFDQQAGGALP